VANKGGLGRGLGALIPSLGPTEIEFEELPVSSIRPNPHQPRKHYDLESFQELIESIKQFGLVQPVVVRPRGEAFELVAGERRWRAAREAGLATIPALIRNSTEAESLEMALVENLQRENLNAIEEAAAYRLLIDEFGISQAELAEKVGKNRVTVTNTLRLLQLPVEIQAEVVEGNISSGHARALLSLSGEDEQKRLAARIAKENLSVRQTESIVRLLVSAREAPRKATAQPKELKAVARRLSKALGTRVKIKMKEEKGRVLIEFESLEDLERIADLIVGTEAKEIPSEAPSPRVRANWNA
jgi:ParB family chromosome partitioning protein